MLIGTLGKEREEKAIVGASSREEKGEREGGEKGKRGNMEAGKMGSSKCKGDEKEEKKDTNERGRMERGEKAQVDMSRIIHRGREGRALTIEGEIDQRGGSDPKGSSHESTGSLYFGYEEHEPPR